MQLIKTWNYSYYNTPFNSFNIFITTCLCTVENYQQCLDQIALMEMTSWSRLIIKFSLIASLNLFASGAIISEWWKSVKELHWSRWSDTTDCLSHSRRFPVKLEIPMCSVALTAQKMKFSIKDSFSKCDQICSFCGFDHIYWRNP